MIWTQQPAETTFIKGMGTRAAKNQTKMICVNAQECIDTEIDLAALKRDEKLRLHIQICRECRQVWNKNLKIKTALKRTIKSETAPDCLMEKIQAMIFKNE